MNVASLRKILRTLPDDKEALLFWDGGARGGVEGIVDADEGVVIVGDWSIYRDGDHRAYKEKQIIYG